MRPAPDADDSSPTRAPRPMPRPVDDGEPGFRVGGARGRSGRGSAPAPALPRYLLATERPRSSVSSRPGLVQVGSPVTVDVRPVRRRQCQSRLRQAAELAGAAMRRDTTIRSREMSLHHLSFAATPRCRALTRSASARWRSISAWSAVSGRRGSCHLHAIDDALRGTARSGSAAARRRLATRARLPQTPFLIGVEDQIAETDHRITCSNLCDLPPRRPVDADRTIVTA